MSTITLVMYSSTSTITFLRTRVQVLKKYSYSSTSTSTRVRLLHLCFHDYFNEYPVSNIKATFMESLGVIFFLLLCH